MQRRLSRRLTLAGIAAALAACAAPTTTPLTNAERRDLRIGSVQVVTSGAAFQGDGAAEIRNFLAPDLTAALRDAFSDRLASDGWLLQAEIGRVAVVGGTATALGRDQSEIAGVLRLVDPGGTLRASVPITVTAGRERESLGGRIVGAAVGGRGRFYRSMVADFASDGRQVLLGRDLPGERLVRRATTPRG